MRGEGGTVAGDDFAGLLRELKERSGLSYGALGKRLHMSGSTLHRYVSGEVVPVEFAPVERLARVCRATPEDLLELHRRWIRAVCGRGRPRAERTRRARGTTRAQRVPRARRARSRTAPRRSRRPRRLRRLRRSHQPRRLRRHCRPRRCRSRRRPRRAPGGCRGPRATPPPAS
ncbi:helix-turn-helix domain-containing protein, partial [Streptomyces scabiei]|uniref:helix-turn-helix domain-containing protein n=1 Tax=Streptomyces scabiei TaxID=1930 RepID=UPI0039EFE4AD